MTIIKRADLGRPLTWDELDNNFRQVDELTAAASAAVSSASVSATAATGSAVDAANSATDAANSAADAAASAGQAIEAANDVSEIAATLPTNEQFTELQTSVDSITADPANAITSITIPALDFSLAIGSASFGMIASRLAGWQFTHGADASVTKMIDLPSHWSKMRISLIWANLVANTGNVSFSGLIHNWSAGESFNQTPSGGGTVAAANATPYIGIETQIPFDLTVDPTRHTTIRVGRNGSSSSDTLPTAMVLLAVRLIKVA